QKAVQGRAREERVAEQLGELVHRAIRRHDSGRALIAVADDLVQVERLVTRERPEPEVVDDQEVGAAQTGERAAHIRSDLESRTASRAVSGLRWLTRRRTPPRS